MSAVPLELLASFAGAAALGAAVGLERQTEEPPGEAGARTFALYAVWGTAAALVGDRFGAAAFGAAALAFGGLVIAAYLVGVRDTDDRGTTTEAAALAVFATGVLAYLDEWVVAVVLAIGTAVLLSSKTWVHRRLAHVQSEDRRIALQFAVVTGIVLPLVPDEPVGPLGAVNPREIWLMVVLVSAIGLIGYVALRAVGSRWLGFTGVVGGIVSSTAVTLGFSRLSRARANLRTVLAGGILGASALMFPRVVIEATAVAPGLGSRLAAILLPIGLALGAVAAWWLRSPRHSREEAPGTVEVHNPLSLPVAVQFGALYGVVILIAAVLIDRAQASSLVWVGVASGIADVDAVTLAMANLVRNGVAVETGVRTVLLAVATNTLVKAGLVALLGTPALRRAVGLTLVPAAAVTGAAAVLLT